MSAALLLISATAAAAAEVIDRIAATVGKQVIAESQVYEEIRVTAFLAGAQPDWSDSSRLQTVNRLVDQTLIRREIDATRFPEAPPEEAAKLLEQLKTATKDFEASLASNRLTDAIIQKHLQWQVTLLRFVEYRFKPGVEVTDTELNDFYASQVKQWKAEGKAVPTLDEVRPDLERLLTAKYVDQALDLWLGDQRTETAIVVKYSK